MSREAVLIVDDEPSLLEVLSVGLGLTFDTIAVDSVAAAAAALDSRRIDLVLTDLKLGDGTGLDVLRVVRERAPDVGVIVLTAHGTTDAAVAAMKAGAADFLTKPFDLDELAIRATAAVRESRLRLENKALRDQMAATTQPGAMLGHSPPILDLRRTIRAVAPTASTVLITGESGTGKELVARALHAESPRAKAPFVSVNCAAVSENLLESELFGHVRGAFTGANETRRGLFETAHKGTLFLDEIGEMPLAMQAKLLRVLQERSVRPVGGNRETPIDVRVIAATNKHLDDLVGQGRFRDDLYFRLNVIPILVPPLRERIDDIPILATAFCERFSARMRRDPLSVSAAVFDVLKRHTWPGNVRELENVIERAVALETSHALLPETLALRTRAAAAVTEVADLPSVPLPEYLEQEEQRIVSAALARANGDRRLAGEILGVTPRALRYLLKKAKNGRAGQ